MAYNKITQFADVPNFSAARINALSFDPSFNNDAVLNSPLVVRSAELDALATSGAAVTSVPYWNPLDAIEPNVASHDESKMAPIHGIGGGVQIARLHLRDEVLGANRVTSTLRQTDVMGQIASRLERYWIDTRRAHVAAILTGISKAAGADHTHDAAGVLTLKAILAGLQKAGDAKGKFKTIVMNSLQEYYLQDAQIGYKPSAETNTNFSTIGGLNIVVSDDMPTTMVALVADRGFGFGEGNLSPNKALAYQSEERAANGWGVDELISRRQYILHPQGFSFVGDVAEAAPTNAEQSNGNDWQLVSTNKKALPFKFIKVTETPVVTP